MCVCVCGGGGGGWGGVAMNERSHLPALDDCAVAWCHLFVRLLFSLFARFSFLRDCGFGMGTKK